MRSNSLIDINVSNNVNVSDHIRSVTSIIDEDNNILVNYTQPYVILSPAVQPIEFIGKRVLCSSNSWINKTILKMSYSWICIIFGCLIMLFSMYYTTNDSRFGINPAPLTLLPMLPTLFLISLEFSHIDRTIFKALTKTFSWWYLIGNIIVHAIATFYHYSYGLKHKHDTEDKKISWTSVPGFLFAYIFFVTLDAHVYRRLNVKRIFMLLGAINLIRFFILEYLSSDDHRDPLHEQKVCLLSCISVVKLRYTTAFIMSLYLIRMIIVSFSRSADALLLRVPLCFTFEMKTDSESVLNSISNQTSQNKAVLTQMISGLSYKLVASGKTSSLQFRASKLDVLFNKDFFWTLARTKYYPYIITLYIAFVVSVLILRKMETPIWLPICLNIPSIFFGLCEMTRIHKGLFFELIKRFEWKYLLAATLLLISQVLLRNITVKQDFPVAFSLYYTPFQILVGLTLCISLDAHVTSIAVRIKRVALSIISLGIFLVLLIRRSSSYQDHNVKKWCHLWCSDTRSLEDAALLQLFIFVSKFTYFAFVQPNRFMIINDHVNIISA